MSAGFDRNAVERCLEQYASHSTGHDLAVDMVTAGAAVIIEHGNLAERCRQRFQAFGFTESMSEHLWTATQRSVEGGLPITCEELALDHIDAVLGPQEPVDIDPIKSDQGTDPVFRDFEIDQERNTRPIITRVVSKLMRQSDDGLVQAVEEALARLPAVEDCTVYYHATTTKAIQWMRGGIDTAECRRNLDFNRARNGFYITQILTQAVQWARYKSEHGGLGACPAVFVYRVPNSGRDALTRLVYDDNDAMSVGTETAGLGRTLFDLALFCREGLPFIDDSRTHFNRKRAIDNFPHWIEGKYLLDPRVRPANWTFGGHQVCVKTGGRRNNVFAATDLLDNSLDGLIMWWQAPQPR